MVVKTFKDITGQEFVAEVVNEETLEIKNPLCFIPTENGLVPMPYVVTSKDNLVINPDKILFGPLDPIENIVNSYKQMFGGISIPQKSLIL